LLNQTKKLEACGENKTKTAQKENAFGKVMRQPRSQALPYLVGKTLAIAGHVHGSQILGVKLKLYLGRDGRGVNLFYLKNYNLCVIAWGDKI
jgi:hypothetical protein